MNSTYQIGSTLSIKDVPLLPKPTSALVVGKNNVVNQVGIDYAVTYNSNNLITSGAVYKAIQDGLSRTKLTSIPTEEPATGGGETINLAQGVGISLVVGGGFTTINNTITTLGALVDVEDYATGKPLAGHSIIWQGGDYPIGSWVFMKTPAPALLSEIGDVAATVPADGYVLTYRNDGSGWRPESGGATHALTAHSDYTLTPTGSIYNGWGWDDQIKPTATLGQNSILIRTNANEWVPLSLDYVISNHGHAWGDVSGTAAGIYSWMNSNLVQGTGMTLTKNGTTVTVTNAITKLGDLLDVENYSTGNPLAGETIIWQGGDWPTGQWTHMVQPAPANLSLIGDVSNAVPANGYVLTYNGGTWSGQTINASHALTAHSDYTLTPSGSIYNGWGWNDQVTPTAALGQNSILIRTNASEWVPLSLDYVISNHGHAWSAITGTAAGIYSWMNSNLIQGTGMTLTKNGTTVTVTNAFTTLGSLTDVQSYASNTPIAGEVLKYQGIYGSGGQWESHPISIANLSSIDDVTNSPASGQFLKYNGSSWVTASTGDSHSMLTHQYVADYAPAGTLNAMFAGYYGSGAGVDHILIKTNYASYDEWTTMNLASFMANYGGGGDLWTESGGSIYRNSLVGVGMSSAPAKKLDIYGSNSGGFGTSVTTMRIRNGYTTAFGSEASLVFAFGASASDTSNVAGISAVYDNWNATNGIGGALKFYTRDSASQTAPSAKMILDKSGYLSLGTFATTANTLLHVEGTGTHLARFKVDSDIIDIHDYGIEGNRADVYFRNGRDSGNVRLQTIKSSSWWTGVFLDGTYERVGINDTHTPAYTLDVNGNIRGTLLMYADQGIKLRNNAEGVIDYDAGNGTLDFLSAGSIYFKASDDAGYAANWVASSDVRLKRNIKYRPKGWLPTISKIGKLVVNYDWIEGYGSDNRQIGFIAQDIISLMPEVVSVGKEYYAVDYDKMVAPLYSGVAELADENRRLKDKVYSLECQMEDLRKAICR